MIFSSKIKCIGFSINLIILYLNLSLISFQFPNNFNNKRIIFKSCDYFIVNILKNTYKHISSYLINKYNTNKRYSYIRSINKKTLKIKSTGLFNGYYHTNWLNSKLADKYILSLDNNEPDYLIYNVFNDNDLNSNYSDAIRIAIYTENVMPDINYADYIIGHYHINYLDRYFKYSIFLWQNFSDIIKKRQEVMKMPIRKKFCAAVISNCRARFRLNFIHKLSQYKKVDIEGRCKFFNNSQKIKNKIEFLSNYKFSLSMENSDGDGYISEKIVHSFSAGTIPIYYGNYCLDEYINPKTYILIKGEKDIDKKIEYIKMIDNNDTLYLSIMKENPIIEKNIINKIDNEEIKSFLNNIFIQDKNRAFRRDDNYYDFNCK